MLILGVVSCDDATMDGLNLDIVLDAVRRAKALHARRQRDVVSSEEAARRIGMDLDEFMEHHLIQKAMHIYHTGDVFERRYVSKSVDLYARTGDGRYKIDLGKFG